MCAVDQTCRTERRLLAWRGFLEAVIVTTQGTCWPPLRARNLFPWPGYLVLGVRQTPPVIREGYPLPSHPTTVTGDRSTECGQGPQPPPTPASTWLFKDLGSGAWPLRVSACSSVKWAVVAGSGNQNSAIAPLLKEIVLRAPGWLSR